MSNTYSMPASERSQRLAFLRLLAIKAHASVNHLIMQMRFTLNIAGRVARTAANTTLAVATTAAGYDLLSHATRTVVRTGWGLLRRVCRGIGAAARTVGRAVTGVVSWVSPTAADTLTRAARTWIATPITRTLRTVDRWARTAGEIVWALAGTPLVRTTTVRAAQAITAFIGLNAATQGRVAAAIVRALPWTMDAIIALTTPWKALALVAGTWVTAMAVTLARILTGNSGDTPPAPEQPTQGTHEQETAPGADQPPEIDLEKVAATLTIDIAADGTVIVSGIPDTVPTDVGQRIADLAAQAAEKQFDRILRTRRTPSRDDRRVLTKVAREAVSNAHTTTVT